MVALIKLSGLVSIFVIYILLGCLAFAIVFLFDVNKIRQIHPFLNFTFVIAFIIQVWATAGVFFHGTPDFYLPHFFHSLFTVMSILCFVLMIYALFIALPFRNTYLKIEKENKVIDTGMYALCRHPGVIWFFFLYIFIWLVSGRMIMLWAALTWTLLDIIHVYIQDRWQFPIMLKGYDVYIREVPFLIPTKQSIKNSLRCNN